MKKLKLFSLLMLLFVGIGQMWGAETAITVSANPTNSGTFTISAVKSSGSNAPIVTGGYVRCYANNKITISTSGDANMTGMTIAWTKNGSKTFASVTASTGTYSHPSAAGNGTWSGSAKSVDFTVGSSGQIQITSVTITTEESVSDKPSPFLNHSKTSYNLLIYSLTRPFQLYAIFTHIIPYLTPPYIYYVYIQ